MLNPLILPLRPRRWSAHCPPDRGKAGLQPYTDTQYHINLLAELSRTLNNISPRNICETRYVAQLAAARRHTRCQRLRAAAAVTLEPTSTLFCPWHCNNTTMKRCSRMKRKKSPDCLLSFFFLCVCVFTCVHTVTAVASLLLFPSLRACECECGRTPHGPHGLPVCNEEGGSASMLAQSYNWPGGK